MRGKRGLASHKAGCPASWLYLQTGSVPAQLSPALCDTLDYRPPDSSVQGFPRQEYWSRLPFSTPGDLSDSGIKSVSPALLADSLPLSHLGSPTILQNPINPSKTYTRCFLKILMLCLITQNSKHHFIRGI